MAEISPQTLIVAIQAIDAERDKLEQDRADTDGPEAPDLDELLMSIDRAASELEEAYAVAQAKYDNLPAYAKLVGS